MTSIQNVAAVTAEDFDLVVLGSGEGSKFLAWTLARQGKRVAVVEQRWIGGSCPNVACLPSKNIIHSAKVASYFARADEFGIETAGFKVNMAKVTNRKRTMVKGLVDTVLQGLLSLPQLPQGGHWDSPHASRNWDTRSEPHPMRCCRSGSSRSV